ncbi:MAG: sucrose synthase [Candidatus Coatesbacteria bacterium]|nr:sucrose synthase [Candidatus Coatesbacteria bacterium]
MSNELESFVRDNREDVHLLLRHFLSLGKSFLLHSEIWDEFERFCELAEKGHLRDSALARVLRLTQEAVLKDPLIYLAERPRIAEWAYILFDMESMKMQRLPLTSFLEAKERLVNGTASDNEWTLEIDLAPFNREFFKLKEARSIGRGVEFLNRWLSTDLFRDLDTGGKLLLDFLRVHQYRGMQLMLNGRIADLKELRHALNLAEEALSDVSQETPWAQLSGQMKSLGFEPGWGKNAKFMRETLGLLSDILEAPEPVRLERFLAQIPMIFNLVILSPHGYFAQSDVLGRPDTGGQVVYILDQVRALEKEMRRRIARQGLSIEPRILVVTRLIPESDGTTCDQRDEAIIGTKNARILRVPFRYPDGRVVPHWMSRFEVWPFLERFVADVEEEVLAALHGRPDLIMGNYSDGNLVASLLSQRLGVTQCNIAHALEKPKLLLADLYWKDNDPQYHLGCLFTADLISMNTADFIITSTYQEIAGTEDSVGQYESYSAFTMPGLYRVVNGIDIFDPKFNVVSPGVDESVYFPFTETLRRLTGLAEELQALVYGADPRPDARGILQDHRKPLIYTIGRLDNVKNLTGLVRMFGECEELRDEANMLLVAGHINPSDSVDDEERRQIELMHSLIDEYDLEGQVRWIGAQLRKDLAGELYRYVADQKGVFVQPALFEAFGLTVIEAMLTGLPTFATCYGGPLEIIEPGVSGFHINPTHSGEVAQFIADFLRRCRSNPKLWDSISKGGIARVKARYTWKLHAERLMTFARVYGFWKHVTNLERDETRRYLQMFYGLQFRKLAEEIPH